MNVTHENRERVLKQRMEIRMQGAVCCLVHRTSWAPYTYMAWWGDRSLPICCAVLADPLLSRRPA